MSAHDSLPVISSDHSPEERFLDCALVRCRNGGKTTRVKNTNRPCQSASVTTQSLIAKVGDRTYREATSQREAASRAFLHTTFFSAAEPVTPRAVLTKTVVGQPHHACQEPLGEDPGELVAARDHADRVERDRLNPPGGGSA